MTRHPLRLLLLPLLLALLPACQNTIIAGGEGGVAGPDEATMLAAALELDDRFLAAFNEGRSTDIVSLFHRSPDTVLYAPEGPPLVGYDAIAAAWTEDMGPGGPQLSWLDHNAMVAGEYVIAWGTWRMTMETPGGTITSDGRFTSVAAERDGAWVYLIDHASMPMGGGDEGAPQ